MTKNSPLCAIILLGVIAVVSFVFVYMVIHHNKPCKDGVCMVKIDLGYLKGKERTTVLNKKTFYSFQGIPYAKPPVGALRFKDPLPIDHWHTVIDASKEGSPCIQRDHRTEGDDGIYGSEDCLFLNVYTTQFPDHDVPLHPVMVYFHGGGFTHGSGSEESYGADYLVELDVVVVTLNYRIGALGFLSLSNDDISGNAGLKDQNMALKWIKEHIIHFGGDPNQVTIFGTSAGSASVQYHMLSPLSKGLFHNAIMFSGSALNPWAFEEYPVQTAFRFGKILNIQARDLNELAIVLRQLSPQEIVKYQESAKTKEQKERCLDFPFKPTIEKSSHNAFLTEHPKILLEFGNFTHVPLIIGETENEGLVSFYGSNINRLWSSDSGKFLPDDLHLDKESPEFLEIITWIHQHYYSRKVNSNLTSEVANIVKLCGDIEFTLGIQRSIDYILKKSTAPLFVEKFTYDGKFSFQKEKTIKLHNESLILPAGPGHGDDTPYFFYDHESNKVKDSKQEGEMVKYFTALLASFASFQNPTQSSGIKWTPTTEKHPNYLEIVLPLKEVNETLMPADKIELWDSIYASKLLLN